jgi:hypothetical protein
VAPHEAMPFWCSLYVIDAGSIVVYLGYEEGRLKTLTETLGGLTEPPNTVIAQPFDLEQVFKKVCPMTVRLHAGTHSCILTSATPD